MVTVCRRTPESRKQCSHYPKQIQVHTKSARVKAPLLSHLVIAVLDSISQLNTRVTPETLQCVLSSMKNTYFIQIVNRI